MALKTISFKDGEILKENYEYSGFITWVTDGDTVRIMTDLGLDQSWGRIRADKDRKKEGAPFRLKGVYAFEKNLKLKQSEEEKQLGIEATEILYKYLPCDKKIAFTTYRNRKGKYGRYLANIYTPEIGEDISLNMYLLRTYPDHFKTKVEWDRIISSREERLGLEKGSITY